VGGARRAERASPRGSRQERGLEEVPFCVGGVFAASRVAIRSSSVGLYRRLLARLSVGDNLEEGHYAERAYLLLMGVRSWRHMRTSLAVYTVVDTSADQGGDAAHLAPASAPCNRSAISPRSRIALHCLCFSDSAAVLALARARGWHTSLIVPLATSPASLPPASRARSQVKPSQAKPSRAEPSQAKPSRAKPTGLPPTSRASDHKSGQVKPGQVEYSTSDDVTAPQTTWPTALRLKLDPHAWVQLHSYDYTAFVDARVTANVPAILEAISRTLGNSGASVLVEAQRPSRAARRAGGRSGSRAAREMPLRVVVRRMTAEAAAFGRAWFREANAAVAPPGDTHRGCSRPGTNCSIGLADVRLREGLCSRFKKVVSVLPPEVQRLSPLTTTHEQLAKWWEWWKCRASCCRPRVKTLTAVPDT